MSVEILTCGQPDPEKEECLSGGPDIDFLLSIVRRGSLHLQAQGRCEDLQDEDLISSLPAETSVEKVLSLCRTRAPLATSAPLSRQWSPARLGGREPGREIVVFQWNILSQALGTSVDCFQSPAACLDWESRKWRVVEEIVRQEADIICLQEVDHFRLLERVLASLGYLGRFVAKPDSPCLYVANNNGPDGCAIFYRADTFSCERVESKVLSVWGVASNQVGLALSLRHTNTGRRLVCATTHLKARTGRLNVMMRAEQGRQLVQWINSIRQDQDVLLTGDLNAEPEEPLLDILTSPVLQLASSYNLRQTEFTSCKVRESGREVKVLDYILSSPGLQTVSTLELPHLASLGPGLLPSPAFPSDHLSLAATIRL